MTEFVLVRIRFIHGENHAVVERGYVNETPIVRGRNLFRLLEVIGSSGFTMVNFDAEVIFGRETYFAMFQRPANTGSKPLEDVVREAASG